MMEGPRSISLSEWVPAEQRKTLGRLGPTIALRYFRTLSIPAEYADLTRRMDAQDICLPFGDGVFYLDFFWGKMIMQY